MTTGVANQTNTKAPDCEEVLFKSEPSMFEGFLGGRTFDLRAWDLSDPRCAALKEGALNARGDFEAKTQRVVFQEKGTGRRVTFTLKEMRFPPWAKGYVVFLLGAPQFDLAAPAVVTVHPQELAESVGGALADALDKAKKPDEGQPGPGPTEPAPGPCDWCLAQVPKDADGRHVLVLGDTVACRDLSTPEIKRAAEVSDGR